MFLLIYGDDLLITGFDSVLIDDMKGVLQKAFQLNFLGSLRYFLDLEVSPSSKGLVINQRKYGVDFYCGS